MESYFRKPFDDVWQDKDEKTEVDARRQHESVLYRLSSLKDELNRLSVARKASISSCEPICMAEQQCCILGVIKSLKEELKYLAELNKKTDSEVSSNLPSDVINVIKSNLCSIRVRQIPYRVFVKCGLWEWPFNNWYLQECSLELDVASHHREVVRKLKSLQEELVKMLRGLQDHSWEVLPQDLGCLCDSSQKLSPFIPVSSSFDPSSSTAASIRLNFPSWLLNLNSFGSIDVTVCCDGVTNIEASCENHNEPVNIC